MLPQILIFSLINKKIKAPFISNNNSNKIKNLTIIIHNYNKILNRTNKVKIKNKNVFIILIALILKIINANYRMIRYVLIL